MENAKKEHQLIISISPHIKSEETTSRIMWSVTASLVPAAVMGVYFFGPRAAFNLALTIIGALAAEYAFQKILKRKNTLGEAAQPEPAGGLLN